jgi:hypothetical protein
MNLAHPEFVSVCGGYGLPHPVLISWLHSLNCIRTSARITRGCGTGNAGSSR